MKKTVPFLNVIPQSGSGTKTFIYYRVHRLKSTAGLARNFPRCICACGSDSWKWVHLKVRECFALAHEKLLKLSKYQRKPSAWNGACCKIRTKSTFHTIRFKWKESHNTEQLILHPLCRVLQRNYLLRAIFEHFVWAVTLVTFTENDVLHIIAHVTSRKIKQKFRPGPREQNYDLKRMLILQHFK